MHAACQVRESAPGARLSQQQTLVRAVLYDYVVLVAFEACSN